MAGVSTTLRAWERVAPPEHFAPPPASFLCQILLGASPCPQAAVLMPAPWRREAEKPLLGGRESLRGREQEARSQTSAQAGVKLAWAAGHGLLPTISVIAISPRA